MSLHFRLVENGRLKYFIIAMIAMINSDEDSGIQPDSAPAEVEQSIDELPKSEQAAEIKSADSRKEPEDVANVPGERH